MKTIPATMPAMRRENERLKAQLAALHEFLQRDRNSEWETKRINADMAVRMAQARRILEGKDE